MFPATTKGGGQCVAFPDVCKVPAPPAAPVPTPFPNTAQCANASGATVTKRVKILNKPALHQGSEIPMSSGDEPGVLKGVVSNTHMDRARFKTFSSKVFFEGSKAVRHLATTGQNGSNANMPAGTQVSPSQTKVIVGG